MKKLNNIYEVLKQDSRFVGKDGNLLKNKIYEYAMKMDNELIKLLYSNEKTREQFFCETEEFKVFDKNKFGWLVDSSDFLPDSYTAFGSKIKLIDDKRNSIKKSQDVVLSFPFKDCILEADSTKEEEEREEVFFNEILMKSEIDTLLDPKILTNSKRYTTGGIDNEIEVKEDDNLIIKGNNLLVLHSLLPKYRGKIKCMYWDVLYNTKSDNVPYNDSFKHSSWLVMMKNRLEIAKDLLKENGCIFIQLDGNEMAYLKVLCDEIFDRENFITMITCKVKAPSGVSSGAQMFFDSSEYILCYAKNKDMLKYYNIKVDTEIINETSKTACNYNMILNKLDYSKKKFLTEIDNIKIYKIEHKFVDIQKMKNNEMTEENYYINREKIFRTASLSGGTEKKVKAYIDKFENTEDVFIYEYVPSKGKNKGVLTSNLVYKKNAILMLKDYSRVDEKNKYVIKQDYITNIFNNDWWQGIASEGSVKLKNGKKPEILIQRLLECATEPGDIVLDAYLGSGTTAAVAHKMNRQYIGIEQLDSHMKKSLSRMINVINADQTGISKTVNWQGGGSFVYCELKGLSNSYRERILSSSNEELINLYNELNDNEFVSYRVDINELEKNKAEFKNLSKNDKVKILNNIIDKNTLYVNYSDMEDESYNITKTDKIFNNSFYKRKGE